MRGTRVIAAGAAIAFLTALGGVVGPPGAGAESPGTGVAVHAANAGAAVVVGAAAPRAAAATGWPRPTGW